MIKINLNGYREFLKGKLSFRKEFIKEYKKEGFDKVYYENEFLGYGYLDFRDKFPLRIYSFEIEDFEEAFKENLKVAIKRRKKLNYYDVGRIVFSDSDFLPGFIFDKYKDIGVILADSPLYNQNLVFEELKKHVKTIYDKKNEKLLFGDKKEVIVEEGKARFIVSVEGQKTGFYLDQRENRLKFYNEIDEGESVLDAFCYEGCFGIHALLKGCEVSFVEKSKKAIELLKRNLELNNVEGKIFCENFFDFVKRDKKFDVVITDPPNLSEKMKINEAFKSYYLIAYYGLKMAKRLFIYCICDPNVDLYQMISLIQKASRRLRKNVEIKDITFQSKDHVISHPSMLYLKVLWVEV